MAHETVVTLAADEVLRRARESFLRRVPATGAVAESESPRRVALRGQGGEELAIAAVERGA